ncbi:MAG: sigma-70 family RNA polymerase sigma factor [Bacteroidales bacterium]|nr:sigma-70 family RNA polymerase sigma factor [Bacteroidales bacterium]MCF8332557.1 sigma-70 family RNA polymerase sigma factor [Bacteroidales bacterium]
MSKQKHDISEWVESYTSDMFSYAFHKLSDEELAREIVQDTFVTVAEKIQDFRGESTPKTWLFSILKYKIIEVYREKTKTPLPADNTMLSNFFDEYDSWLQNQKPMPRGNDDLHLLDDAEFQNVLKRCLEALPEKWSSSVKLKYLMNKKGAEICQELDISPTNFWQIMHRAKLNLRDCLEKNWFQN